VVAHLLAAMVRVLSGRPSIAEPSDLTITAVAVESGLKRHYLTHKHPELKDLFYQLRDHHQNPVKHDAAQLKSEIDDLKRRLGDANDQRRKWKTTAVGHMLAPSRYSPSKRASCSRACSPVPTPRSPCYRTGIMTGVARPDDQRWAIPPRQTRTHRFAGWPRDDSPDHPLPKSRPPGSDAPTELSPALRNTDVVKTSIRVATLSAVMLTSPMLLVDSPASADPVLMR